MRLDHLLSKERSGRRKPEAVPGRLRRKGAGEEAETRRRGQTEAQRRACKHASGEHSMSVSRKDREEAVDQAQKAIACIVFRVCPEGPGDRARGRILTHLDNCTGKEETGRPVATDDGRPESVGSWSQEKRRKNQAKKSTGWMPRRQPPKKDVASCEKLRGAASKHRSADIRMGEPIQRKVWIPTDEHIVCEEGTRGTETSKYPEEEKTTVIS